ncbi:MAG: oxygenase [Zetaproteobacteria bacterium]|nr:MAG: oxygenase [Zetaproteobacteria bacterium]
MPIIRFEGKDYACQEGESVLECLERHGVLLPSGCRAGACQTCMVRALSGTPPKEAQQGLKDTLAAQGYFLACIARPTEDLEIGLGKEEPVWQARVAERRMLNAQVLGLWLDKPEGFDYYAGQFINLRHPDGIVRSYSLASLPEEERLELHVKRVPGGKMSNWLHDAVAEGDVLSFQGPAGDSFYLPGNPAQPLLLAGSGTGLAPLYGIARAALAAGHTGEIHLFHGSLRREGLYYQDELRALDRAHPNFHYHPVVLEGEPPEGGAVADLKTHPFEAVGGDLSGWRVFLCGDPELVEAMKKQAFLAGAPMKAIYSDPFVFAPAA